MRHKEKSEFDGAVPIPFAVVESMETERNFTHP